MSGEDLLLLGSVACSGGFYVAAAIAYFLRRPLTPPDMAGTSDLGQENPAVANLLANGGTVTPDAVPATLLDLAARRVIQVEESQPHVYSVRIGGGAAPTLTAYESRVLSLLRTKASRGVVPAAALTTGVSSQARSWFRSFAAEVVAEAKAAGLCSPRWPPRMLTILGLFTGGALLLFLFTATESDEQSISCSSSPRPACRARRAGWRCASTCTAMSSLPLCRPPRSSCANDISHTAQRLASPPPPCERSPWAPRTTTAHGAATAAVGGR